VRGVVVATLMRREGGTGVQTHARTVVEHSVAAGRESSVVTPFEASSPLLAPAFALRQPLRVVSRPAAVWWYRAGHAHYLRQALGAELARRPGAVVYAQCPVSAAVALDVRHDQPVVLAVHFNHSQAEEWTGKGEVRRDGRVFRGIEALDRDVLPRVDGLVYVSEDSRELVEARIPAAARVPSMVLPNPVPGRPGGNAPAMTGDLITVGSLEPRKNHAYLLDILARAHGAGRRYSLTIVGEGPEFGSLREHARHLNLGEHVRFAGYRTDVTDLLRGHRAYVHTAVAESFGIVLVEAMHAGLPVVAAPVGGIPEVVRDGRDGLFWPLDDAAAAAEVLTGLLDDPARCAAMAAAARQGAQRFEPAVLMPRLLSFLDGCQKAAKPVSRHV